MKHLQLYKDAHQMLGSDGVMKVDGRLSMDSIIREVRSRNARYSKNFPHKVADSFAICRGRAWNDPGERISV